MGWYRLDVPAGHPQFGKAQRCACQSESDKWRTYERAQKASNLTEFLLQKKLADYRPTPGTKHAYDAAVRFAKQPTGWLYLYGGTGTGKTHLMAAIANALMHTTAAPLYVVVPDWLAYLREGFEAGESERCEARMNQAKSIPVLLLDDIGVEKRSEWTDEQLYRLLNHRYNAMLPTVVSSNLAPSQLEPRIASRLQDTSISDLVGLVGNDHRTSRTRDGGAAS